MSCASPRLALHECRSRIGFHAAYSSKTGQETGVGNALVGAYLNKIGLPYSAVIYISQAAPNSMTWLSIADAEKQGIDVKPSFRVERVDVASRQRLTNSPETPPVVSSVPMSEAERML
jgi:hypothetical protein